MRAPAAVDDLAEWLSRWLDSRGVAGGPVTGLTPVRGGTQNRILRFRRGGQDMIFRGPAPGRRDAAKSFERECRVLRALDRTDVPHPRLIAHQVDEGDASFYVMEAVDGVSPAAGLPEAYRRPEWQRSLAFSVVDAAAAIGAVDCAELGLADLGRGSDFLGRQVVRWRAQLESYTAIGDYDVAEIGVVMPVEAWLADNVPVGDAPGLLHGDYHLANILCATTSPVVVAVLDWELATVGDPRLDLGWLLATWSADFPEVPGSVGPAPWFDPAPEAEMAARYEARSGRDVTDLAWFKILACYKLAVILEGTSARARVGAASHNVGVRLHGNALGLLDRARQWVAQQ